MIAIDEILCYDCFPSGLTDKEYFDKMSAIIPAFPPDITRIKIVCRRCGRVIGEYRKPKRR